MARPSKIDRFIEEAEKVLKNKNLMLLTDEELVFLINENLEEKERVAIRTFKLWKSGDYAEKGETGKKFLPLIKKALLIQKENLYKSMLSDDRAWQKYAWIIERKFAEWNLKHISENFNKNENENTNTNVEIDYTKLDEQTLKNLIKQLGSNKDSE